MHVSFFWGGNSWINQQPDSGLEFRHLWQRIHVSLVMMGLCYNVRGFLLFSEKWNSLYGTPQKNNDKTKDQNTKCKSLKGRTKPCLVLKLEDENMFVYSVPFETKNTLNIFCNLYVYIFTQNETTSPSCEISPTHSLRNNKTSDFNQKLFASIPFQALLPPTVINFWMKPGEQRWNKGQLRYLAGRTKEVIKKHWKRSRETGSPTNSFNLAQGNSSEPSKTSIFGFQCQFSRVYSSSIFHVLCCFAHFVSMFFRFEIATKNGAWKLNIQFSVLVLLLTPSSMHKFLIDIFWGGRILHWDHYNLISTSLAMWCCEKWLMMCRKCWFMLLMVQKSGDHHLGCIKPCKYSNVTNYLYLLVNWCRNDVWQKSNHFLISSLLSSKTILYKPRTLRGESVTLSMVGYYPSSHHRGSVENGCISNISFPFI